MTDYIKIGRINMTRAREAHIKSADIMINKNHIKHIEKKHKSELDALGLSAFDFVRIIVDQYTEIRIAPENALNLVLKSNQRLFVAVITLNFNDIKDFWEIKTALPMRSAVINSRKLIWKRERTPIKN